MKKVIIQRLARLAILTALCCVLRIWMAALPNIKPITALFFVFALYFGLADSLVIMALTMTVTGILLGFSPIILGQIIVYGLIILLFKFLTELSKNNLILSIFSGLLALLYGALIDIFSGILFGFGTGGFIGYWLAGLPFDLAHAVSTFLFFPLIIFIFKRIKTLK
ncbi:ECF transporter S component [Lactococcus nasutitermitis]|uniref:ECF transporter S component n=1 Tax=Lactococcus nasutitermitis TaxID=1652957 RepID=A0ABV9JCT9_9LACT|nr:ECF transporter S component [Lactococcus nasutitermitis]